MNDISFLQETWQKIKSLINMNNLAYFMGAAFILAAMERLMYLVRISFDRTGLLLAALALCYAIVFMFVGYKIQHSAQFSIISPLLFTLALFMLSPFIQGIQHHFYLWISYGEKAAYLNRLTEYAAATIGSLVLIYWTKIPFLVMPLLFFTSFFLTSVSDLFTTLDLYAFARGLINIALSIAVLPIFFVMRKKGKEYFALFGYISAMALLQHGIYDLVYNSDYQGPEWLKIMMPFLSTPGGIYWGDLLFRILLAFLVNIGLVTIALRCRNYVFLIFGALGTVGYFISMLRKSFDIFNFHAGLPLILSFLAISILLLTVLGVTNKTNKKISPKIALCAYIIGTSLLLAAAFAYNPFWLKTSSHALFLSVITIFYAGIFMWMGHRLLLSEKYTYSGLSFTLAISMVPYFVYGILRYIGLETNGEWSYYIARAGHFNVIYLTPLTLSATTLIATLITMYLTRSSLLMIPLFISAWFLCTRSYLLLSHSSTNIIFGLCMILLAYFIDRKKKKNFAFWGYLGGILVIQLGLAEFANLNRLIFGSARSLYALDLAICLSTNLFFVLLGITFNNKVISILSMLATLIFASILIDNLLGGIISAPLLLSFMGITIILCTIWYVKNQEKINRVTQRLMPKALLKYR